MKTTETLSKSSEVSKSRSEDENIAGANATLVSEGSFSNIEGLEEPPAKAPASVGDAAAPVLQSGVVAAERLRRKRRHSTRGRIRRMIHLHNWLGAAVRWLVGLALLMLLGWILVNFVYPQWMGGGK
ncbi:MAG TPA: hypothetical protein VFJ58_13880 [Armatimonadota bacterium]|nr:hypothetical protein [Armatimonadota bacterium]